MMLTCHEGARQATFISTAFVLLLILGLVFGLVLWLIFGLIFGLVSWLVFEPIPSIMLVGLDGDGRCGVGPSVLVSGQ